MVNFEKATEIIRATLNGFSDEERAKILAQFSSRTERSNAIQLTREQIESALVMYNGRLEIVARVLNCSRRTLQTKMRQLGFSPTKPGPKPRKVF